jgi:hypothetical protein
LVGAEDKVAFDVVAGELVLGEAGDAGKGEGLTIFD